jgi:hypothetical protein
MTAPHRPRRRPFGALAGLAVVVVGGWTGAWFWIRGQIADNIDLTLKQFAQVGIEVTCPNRRLGGWPFRIDVSCEAPTVRIPTRGVAVDLARLSVTGLVYRPDVYIAEAVGPLTVRRGSESGDATWGTFRASLALSKNALQRFSMETRDFQGRLLLAGQPEQGLRLAAGEAHLMPATIAGAPVAASAAAASTAPAPGPDDYRIAVSAERAEATMGGARLLPVPVDLTLDVATTDLPGQTLDPRDLADAGAGVDLQRIRVGLGDIVFGGAGRLDIGPTGGLNGVVEVQPIPGTSVAGSPPQAAPASLKAAVTGAMLMFGTNRSSRTGLTGQRLDVVVDEGVVKVGRMTLARLRPLF